MPLQIVEVDYPQPVKKHLRLNERFRFVLRNPGKLRVEFTDGSPLPNGAKKIENAAAAEQEFVAGKLGRFVFDCTFTDPGGKEHRTKGGGELEIDP